MTGTERASLRLALGMLRENACGWDSILTVLYNGHHRVLADVVEEASYEVPHRVLRAWLALHLRSVLRNALGDAEIEHGGRSETWPTTGRWRCYTRFANDVPLVCSECSEPLGYFAGYDEGEEVTQPCPVTGRSAIARRPRPLWLDARGVER